MDASIKGGQQLKRVREQLGLTMRDVEMASSSIASKFENPEFVVNISRLSDIETKGVLPTLYRMFSLAAIYGIDYSEVCSFYGVDLEMQAVAHKCASIPKSHFFSAVKQALRLQVPTTADPSFDVSRTTNLMRMIQKWGTVPASFLSQLATSGHTYVFVGHKDFTMYPLVMPGSFLQIDESKCRVIQEGWRSEYERPIYCIETRHEMICCWCQVDDGKLLTQPHPLSPAKPRVFRHPQEAEVIGQVVGVAMRLDEWFPNGNERSTQRLN
jgi:transcriptional regulator with XRE-family HTH domain